LPKPLPDPEVRMEDKGKGEPPFWENQNKPSKDGATIARWNVRGKVGRRRG